MVDRANKALQELYDDRVDLRIELALLEEQGGSRDLIAVTRDRLASVNARIDEIGKKS